MMLATIAARRGGKLSTYVKALAELPTKTYLAGSKYIEDHLPTEGPQLELPFQAAEVQQARAAQPQGRARAPAAPPSPKITRTAAQLLRAKLREQAKGAQFGFVSGQEAAEARARIREIKRMARAERKKHAEEARILRHKLRSMSRAAEAGARAGQQEALRSAQAVFGKIFGAPPVGAAAAVIEAHERAMAARSAQQVLRAGIEMMRQRLRLAVRAERERGAKVAGDISQLKAEMRTAVQKSGLNPKFQARFLGDIERARNAQDLLEAEAKIQKLLAEQQFTLAIGDFKKALRKYRGAKKVRTEQLAAQIEHLQQQAEAVMLTSAAGKRRRAVYQTAAEYDAHAATIQGAADAIEQAIAQRKATVGAIRANRMRTRDGHVRFIMKRLGWNPATGTFQKKLKGRARILEDLQRSSLSPRVYFRQVMDVDNLSRAAEKSWKGDGVLHHLLHRIPKEAEEDYNVDRREGWKWLDSLIRSTTGIGLAQTLEQWSSTFGQRMTKRETVRLGGQEYDLTIDEILELMLLDDQTLERMTDGKRGFQLVDAKDTARVLPTLSEINDIRARFARYAPLVNAMKAWIETQLRPRLFEAHRLLKGYDPRTVPGYWPTSVNVEESADMGVAEAFREKSIAGLQRRWLENAGFFEERAEHADIPYVIKGGLRRFLEHMDHGLKVIHLAEPIRNAAAVLLDPRIVHAMMNVHGKDMHEKLQKHLLEASLVNADTLGGAEKLLRTVNGNLGATFLTLNPGTYARQIGGVFKIAAYMGPRWFLAGWRGLKPGTIRDMEQHSGYLWARWFGDSAARYSSVHGAGIAGYDTPGFMHAMGTFIYSATTMNRKTVWTAWERMTRSIKILDWFDAISARIAWGGYIAKVQHDHPTWTDAEKMKWVADQTAMAVRSTQNSVSPMDAATMAVRTKNTFMRAMLLFQSDAIKSVNMLIQGYRRGWKTGIYATTGVLMNNLWSGFVVTMGLNAGYEFLGQLIKMALGGDDDEEARAMRKAKALDRAMWRTARDLAGNIPVLGPAIVTSVEAASKPWLQGDALSLPALQAINRVASSFTEVVRALEKYNDEEKADATTMDAIKAFGRLALDATALLGNPGYMLYYHGSRIMEVPLPDEEQRQKKRTPAKAISGI